MLIFNLDIESHTKDISGLSPQYDKDSISQYDKDSSHSERSEESKTRHSERVLQSKTIEESLILTVIYSLQLR